MLPQASLRRICRLLHVSRSSVSADGAADPAPTAAPAAGPPAAGSAADDPVLTALRTLVTTYPTFGYRRLTVLLRTQLQQPINRKRVARLMRAHRWQVTQRSRTPRPRVQEPVSQTSASNQRWAMDVTHVACGRDGWAHLIAIIDCHDRAIVGYQFTRRGRAKEAERALEAACLARYGVARPHGPMPIIRSDNGLIFQSSRFRAACQFYRLDQEYITPYTPQQNGLVERFFRSFKEECVWQHVFGSFAEAEVAVRGWISWYNQERPHQALGYRSPHAYRAQMARAAAPDHARGAEGGPDAAASGLASVSRNGGAAA